MPATNLSLEISQVDHAAMAPHFMFNWQQKLSTISKQKEAPWLGKNLCSSSTHLSSLSSSSMTSSPPVFYREEMTLSMRKAHCNSTNHPLQCMMQLSSQKWNHPKQEHHFESGTSGISWLQLFILVINHISWL